MPPLQKINYDLGETISWPRQVALVGRLYGALPAPERARTMILTGNYGEAGAIERYGPRSGVPTAYSGANNFWLWGPPPAGAAGQVRGPRLFPPADHGFLVHQGHEDRRPN